MTLIPSQHINIILSPEQMMNIGRRNIAGQVWGPDLALVMASHDTLREQLAEEHKQYLAVNAECEEIYRILAEARILLQEIAQTIKEYSYDTDHSTTMEWRRRIITLLGIVE